MFEKYENDLNAFCDAFNAKNVEDLRPFWGGSIKSKMSVNALKFMGICTWRAINVIRGTMANQNSKKENSDWDNLNSYIFVHDKARNIPFFDSGYQGIGLKDIDGNKFYFMVNEGFVGLENHSEASATVGMLCDGKSTYSLTHTSRQFGDVKMHEEDSDRNINFIVNKIVDKFFKN